METGIEEEAREGVCADGHAVDVGDEQTGALVSCRTALALHLRNQELGEYAGELRARGLVFGQQKLHSGIAAAQIGSQDAVNEHHSRTGAASE